MIDILNLTNYKFTEKGCRTEKKERKRIASQRY